jgi:hypothetical protein
MMQVLALHTGVDADSATPVPAAMCDQCSHRYGCPRLGENTTAVRCTSFCLTARLSPALRTACIQLAQQLLPLQYTLTNRN